MTQPSVVVLDYGSGNLRSAERALVRAGARVEVTSDPHGALVADGLVVPGVGAFAACMSGIDAVGGRRLIRERVRQQRPVLGICVGMQVLFTTGVEHGVVTDGIGEWPGVVERLDAPLLPHVGWNTIRAAPGSKLLRGVEDQRFYFVHSYAVKSLPGNGSASGPGSGADPGTDSDETAPIGCPVRLSYTVHAERFVAAVEDGALVATQFHPEKSADAGATVLTNWLGMLR